VLFSAALLVCPPRCELDAAISLLNPRLPPATGFLNSVKIKGSHTAIKSGIEAANAVYDVVKGAASESDAPLEPTAYQSNMENSWVV
jgi:hypothetical protein